MLDTLPQTVHMGNYRTGEGEILNIDDPETAAWMKTHYPAVMADRPINRMSENYQFVDSKQLIRQLAKLGLELVGVQQQFSRQRDPRGQEHIMKFRFPTDGEFGATAVGDSFPELVIMNSHNGRCRAKAYAGLFRLVCSNGMVIADEDYGHFFMRHYGQENTMASFGAGLDAIAKNLSILRVRVEAMQQAILSPHQQNQLARKMMEVRGCPDWVEPALVLEDHRPEDARNEDRTRSLWLTYNVIQENLTSRKLLWEREGERRRSMRPLAGARADIVHNAKLWEVLDSFSRKVLPKEIFKALQVEDAEVAQEAPVDVPAPPEGETPQERKRRKARERYHARKAKEKQTA